MHVNEALASMVEHVFPHDGEDVGAIVGERVGLMVGHGRVTFPSSQQYKAHV